MDTGVPATADAMRASTPQTVANDELERVLAGAIARAAAARPELRLDAAVFVAYLADRCDDVDVLAWASRTAVDDLYLACGCAHGDALALAAFERELVGEVRNAVSRLGLTAADVADVVAEIRAKLFVQGRIRDYGGRCALRSWLRVVATRAGISLARRLRPREDPIELAGLVAQLGDPEAALIAQQLRHELREAFAAAVATLEVSDRNLLRQHLIDGLSIDELAGLYRIHRATAARRIAHARERVWEATVATLRAQLAITPEQLESLVAAVRTGLDLSLERLLAST